jgi:hypothetical protein
MLGLLFYLYTGEFRSSLRYQDESKLWTKDRLEGTVLRDDDGLVRLARDLVDTLCAEQQYASQHAGFRLRGSYPAE